MGQVAKQDLSLGINSVSPSLQEKKYAKEKLQDAKRRHTKHYATYLM